MAPPDSDPPSTALAGRRLLVVGASSGIGRALALEAAASGAAVALTARRLALLEQVAAEAGSRAVALPCDVSDPSACSILADEAAAALDGLDAVLYVAGAAYLGPLAQASAASWRAMLATNVVGAALVTAGALPYLRSAPAPVVAYVSSHSVRRPWPGLVPYAASKAALETMALGLRAEEPWLRVLRVSVGPTITGFSDRWDPAVAGPAFERWAAEGYLVHEPQEASDTARRIVAALADGTGPDDIEVIGPEAG